ncbi:hypothetical protein FALBO_8175 [Fusarium albosuccineum]|uniref:Uncharacterized protein n=1 Tax=Fusarium albosuccineum TaxID=1237068 RepID=A0A8H4LBN1_9HYPO|nr:hypothetical protein FALBO_8175 [Fusarium albosuccineum]
MPIADSKRSLAGNLGPKRSRADAKGGHVKFANWPCRRRELHKSAADPRPEPQKGRQPPEGSFVMGGGGCLQTLVSGPASPRRNASLCGSGCGMLQDEHGPTHGFSATPSRRRNCCLDGHQSDLGRSPYLTDCRRRGTMLGDQRGY